MATKCYKVRGSHRTESTIVRVLQRDPEIHSGMAGRGAFCIKISDTEWQQLKDAGIKIAAKPQY